MRDGGHTGAMAAQPSRPMTPLGERVIARMAEIGMRTQRDLVARAEVGEATITRLLYDHRRPKVETLRQVAVALDLPPDALLTVAYDDASVPLSTFPALPPLAAEIGRMLADDSPIAGEDRERLAAILDAVVAPYRRQMRKRKT